MLNSIDGNNLKVSGGVNKQKSLRVYFKQPVVEGVIVLFFLYKRRVSF